MKAVAGCQIGIADLKVKDGRAAAAAAEALTQLVWWSPKFNSQEDEHIKNVRIHGRSIFFCFYIFYKSIAQRSKLKVTKQTNRYSSWLVKT